MTGAPATHRLFSCSCTRDVAPQLRGTPGSVERECNRERSILFHRCCIADERALMLRQRSLSMPKSSPFSAMARRSESTNACSTGVFGGIAIELEVSRLRHGLRSQTVMRFKAHTCGGSTPLYYRRTPQHKASPQTARPKNHLRTGWATSDEPAAETQNLQWGHTPACPFDTLLRRARWAAEQRPQVREQSGGS